MLIKFVNHLISTKKSRIQETKNLSNYGESKTATTKGALKKSISDIFYKIQNVKKLKIKAVVPFLPQNFKLHSP